MEFIEIRCPFFITSRIIGGNVVPWGKVCNLLCTKVRPGSSGEAFCHSCKLSFEFEVNNQSNTTTSIKVKK